MKPRPSVKPPNEDVTPAALGFSMPAEWEKHEATWIGWPHNPTDWPGKLEPIQWVYGEIVRKISASEIVRILVNSSAHEKHVRGILKLVGVAAARVQFFRMPTNRGWTRDFGPIFLRRDKPRRELAIARFRFNAWARYPDWQKDDAIPQQVARKFKIKLIPARLGNREIVLEGGSIDVNGRGTVLTTEECLLDQKRQVRNPGLTRADTETALKQNLGVTNVVWLGKGIAGDDTHGHVDDLCRFVNPSTVVLIREKNHRDANYRPLEENWERIRDARLETGEKIEAIELPMPAPLHFDGVRLPASYANFYITNAAVLVPTFNDPNDRVALGILAELFPDRPVLGIHAVDLVWGFGTLHCLTQQQPAR
ncbi:MAG: agmatine deiminase family protein [Candidatus Acidiferrales bacterium]